MIYVKFNEQGNIIEVKRNKEDGYVEVPNLNCKLVNGQIVDETDKILEEETKNKRISEIQSRLDQLSQDIVQDMAGEIVPDIEERKAEFVELHNELRELLGKEKRELKEE